MNATQIKEANEAKLSSIGASINPNLPLIEDLTEVLPQTAESVAKRICAIGYVIGVVYDAIPASLWKLIQKYGLEDGVSNHEKEILSQGKTDEKFKNQCSWLPESVQALMWCLHLAELDATRHCDDDLAQRIPFKTDPSEFIKDATIRPVEQIADAADFYYRLHWYCVDCKLNGKESIVPGDTIAERRRALDWAYGIEADWDSVPMDT